MTVLPRDDALLIGDFVTRDTTLTVRGVLGAARSEEKKAQLQPTKCIKWTTLTVIGTSWSYAD
ncbi:hypothetical protein, partial [Escherichia coli]|uniref:hypothetical protein n=1 Tax=Escherichia coli TaxID=562 RepID=UPI003F9EFDC8